MGKVNKKVEKSTSLQKTSNFNSSNEKNQKKNNVSTNKIKKAKNKNKLLFGKTISTKTIKPKKEKQKLRRKSFLNKIDLIKEQKKEEIARKKREKTKITGDLKPLKDALPSLDELFKLKPNEIKTGMSDFDEISKKPLTRKDKAKIRKKEFMDRYNCFTSILKDKDYRKNPREAIAYHIKVRHGKDS